MTKDKDIDEILATEFSPSFARDVLRGEAGKDKERFIELAKGAMTVSFFKYGKVEDGYGPGKAIFALPSINKRVGLYRDGGELKGQSIPPGNTEWLIDVFNYAMIEAMCPRGRYGRRDGSIHFGLDRMGAILANVEEYEKRPQYRFLVAIAKDALGEFCSPAHPNAHFKGTDVSPGRETIEGLSERKNKVGSVGDWR